jgi:hypothetical protein
VHFQRNLVLFLVKLDDGHNIDGVCGEICVRRNAGGF